MPWKRPTDPIFHFLADPNAAYNQETEDKGVSQDNSAVHQGSAMERSETKDGASRSDLDEEQDLGASNHDGIREKYERIKNVFRMLIEEAPYLIDDKAFEKCEGKTLKEQFSIQIDGVRKALGID